MIKFLTRAELNAYISATPREGMYAVDADETMQNKKATFSYFNEELILESGGWKDPNWLADVDTYVDIATTHTTPLGLDAVKVISDEGHSGQPTWYLHNGTSWIYQGVHFVEGIAFDVSDTNTRVADIAPDTDYIISIPYLVGKEHLYIFIDGEEIVKGIDWDEVGTTGFVSTKIQFANTIPKESRLVFKRTVANTNDDKVASRMNKDVWLKFMNDAYTDLDDKILKSSLKIVSTILGKSISGFIQDQTSIMKDNLYLDKTTNKLYIALLDKTGTWVTVNTTDFIHFDMFSGAGKKIKSKVFTGMMPAVGAYISLTHGLDVTKICSYHIVSKSTYPADNIPPNYPTVSFNYWVYYTTSNFIIEVNTGANTIAGKAYTLEIFYYD